MAENIVAKQASKGIDYIINSKRPYPEFIKTHKVFKELPKINKVFPKLGLPNCKEEVKIANTDEAKADAILLGNDIRNILARGIDAAYGKQNALKYSKTNADQEQIRKLTQLIGLTNNLSYEISYQDLIEANGDKVVLKLKRAVRSGDGNSVAFKVGERLLGVMVKIAEEYEKTVGFKLSPVEELASFKAFSKNNVANKKYHVVFSSTGDEGAWDIATISMRGVQSCQTWTQPQSRGLIGSISNKFVGVVYLASETNVEGYGSKMLKRALVRFAINYETKKPALLMDRLYPAHDQSTFEAFKKLLTEKTKLPVLYAGAQDGQHDWNKYYLPDDSNTTNYLAIGNGEFTYMDYKILSKADCPSNKKKLDPYLYETTQKFQAGMPSIVNASLKKIREMYLADKKSAPLMKSGGLNLFKHLEKRAYERSLGQTFLTHILNSIVVPDPELYNSKELYAKAYFMSLMKDAPGIKDRAWKLVSTGTWMKSFPKSTKKLFDHIYEIVKKQGMEEAKKLFKVKAKA